MLGDRAFAFFIVLLGLPNIVPMVPPIPLLSGVLLALVAGQLIYGLPAPWLPRRLLDRSVPRADLRRAVARIMPWLIGIERFCRPRLTLFESRLAARLIGLVTLIVALGLLVAAPIIGQIPLGIAACLIGVGLVERDGFVLIAAAVVGAIGVALAAGFAWAIVSAGLHLLGLG